MESKNATFQLILTLNKVCKAQIQELHSFVLTTTDLAVSHWLHEACFALSFWLRASRCLD